MGRLWKTSAFVAVALCVVMSGYHSDESKAVEDPGAQAAAVKSVAIPIGQIGTYIPAHINGDADFNGNGPEVTILAELHTVADTVWCFVYMRAEETLRDWTTAEGWWAKKLYYAPDGWRLYRVLNPMYCEVQYTDDSYDVRNDQCPADCDPDCHGGFKLASIGDTSGDDAGVTTSVTVSLDTLVVELQRR